VFIFVGKNLFRGNDDFGNSLVWLKLDQLENSDVIVLSTSTDGILKITASFINLLHPEK